MPSPAAVGHRLVHGGPAHVAPERVDARLLDRLRELIPLAPLHLPSEIAVIEAVAARFTDLPQVVCFDTAFHRPMPDLAQRLPLSGDLWDKGVRRYGFHGLSYEYILDALGSAGSGRLIVAHLGNGASLAAIRDGQPRETTMGFTPTGGLMMGTRSGDLDPGVLVYLASREGYDAPRLEEGRRLPWRKPIPSLNILLTSTCWRNDHNGFSHQGPGLIDVVLSKKGTVSRIYLPPDANCLLSVADHCFRSRDYVNLIVIDKQPQLQWLSMDDAVQHCARGASVWQWASNERGQEPDIVLAAAGDAPTLEVVAAAWWLRKHVPELKVRVVNVVDLMALFQPETHPHGMDETSFVDLFGRDTPVVFAFHGYQRAIHQLMHGRPPPERFHVRGFNEEGTTTTPFDMVVRNGMSRYHLCMEALRRVPRMRERARALIGDCQVMLAKHEAYTRAYLEDMPEVRDWVWGAA